MGALVGSGTIRRLGAAWPRERVEIPLVDLHVHLDNSTIDEVVALSRERGVKFGVVEHAGGKENVYPVVLSNDKELRGYLRHLDGKGVYSGIQAEWKDWMSGFSREALAELDYVLTDTMTFPGKMGERVKLWEEGVEERVDLSRPDAFMDRYVDWHLEIIEQQPIDLLANVSWLPAVMAGEAETYWTEARIQKVLDTARKHQVAIEISSSFKLPSLRFLRLAKAAGLKFALGSNGRYPRMGLLEYSLQMAESLDLKAEDFFVPGLKGNKAVERRMW